MPLPVDKESAKVCYQMIGSKINTHCCASPTSSLPSSEACTNILEFIKAKGRLIWRGISSDPYSVLRTHSIPIKLVSQFYPWRLIEMVDVFEELVCSWQKWKIVLPPLDWLFSQFGGTSRGLLRRTILHSRPGQLVNPRPSYQKWEELTSGVHIAYLFACSNPINTFIISNCLNFQLASQFPPAPEQQHYSVQNSNPEPHRTMTSVSWPNSSLAAWLSVNTPLGSGGTITGRWGILSKPLGVASRSGGSYSFDG